MVKSPVLPRDDSKDYLQGVTAAQGHLIGRVIWRWSYIERVAEELIWRFLHLNVEVGRKVTARMDFKFKERILRELSRDAMNSDELNLFLGFMGRLDDLYEIRNMVAHGLWVTIMPDEIPAVQTLREQLPAFAGGSEVVITEMNTAFMKSIDGHLVSSLKFLARYRDATHPSPDKSA